MLINVHFPFIVYLTGNGLGMKVVGGKEVPGSNGMIGAYVAKIFPGGVVETLGEVKEGNKRCFNIICLWMVTYKYFTTHWFLKLFIESVSNFTSFGPVVFELHVKTTITIKRYDWKLCNEANLFTSSWASKAISRIDLQNQN